MEKESYHQDIPSVLAEVASAVVGQFDMDTLLNQIINTTMETLHAEVCSIFLEDKEKDPGVIKCVAGSGFAKKIVGIARYKIGEGLTGTVAKYGEGYNSKSREEHENLKKESEKVWKGKYDHVQWLGGESEFRNGIALPLKIKGQILGVIKAENKLEEYGNFFTDEDLSVFETIANVIALTIENAKLHQKAEGQSKTIYSVLSEVASAVVGHFNMRELLDQIIDKTMTILHAEVCSIFLEDKENEPGVIKCVAGSGYAKRMVGVAKYQIGEGLTGTVAKYGEGYNSKSREQHENLTKGSIKVWKGKYEHLQWPNRESEFRNGIALPLIIKGQTLGVIKAENKLEEYEDFFTDEDLTVFKTVANVIALTIENAKLHQKAEEQSKTISSVLSEVASAVVGHFDMKELLDQIINKTMTTLHAEVCSIFLEDKENEPGVIKCVAGSGYAKRIVGIAKYQIGEGFTGTVAKSGKEFIIRNPQELQIFEKDGIWKKKFDHLQWPFGKSEFRNVLALPLKIKEQILGVIKVENKLKEYGNFFTNEDLRTFRTIANVIALTIENAKLFQKAEEQIKIKEERDVWKEVSFRAAHKIGNALFGLRGHVDWLQIVFDEKPLNEKEIISAIQKAKQRLNEANSIVREFKGYIRPDELKLELANINKVLEQAISEVEKATDDKKIYFNREYTDNLPQIEIDIVKFKQCVKELIENACHFIDKRGQISVRSTISYEYKQKIDMFSEEDFIFIIVKDTGKGVLQENKTKIFQPFFSTTAEGSGLGLAIVQEHIEKYGGKIAEVGDYGIGAEFIIILPDGKDE
ncbi:MAG: GAF domain-containing protein [Desulfobacterales bacterium]|nr:GAF domain-containing protein [Desulfobacterales bacterium]